MLIDHSTDEGVATGSDGTVLEVFDDGYIVEFSRPDGTTISWFSVRDDEVGAANETGSMPVRRADQAMLRSR